MKKEITETEKAYFAGLFDGEGCVNIHKIESSGYDIYSLRVNFGLTYADILYKMKKMFGGTIHKRDVSKRLKAPYMCRAINAGLANPDNFKQTYEYEISGKEAWIFLKIIEPYCEEKKEQVNTAIEFFNGNRSHSGSIGRSKSQAERCEYYYKKLQELKHGKNSEDKELILTDNQTKIDLFSEV